MKVRTAPYHAVVNGNVNNNKNEIIMSPYTIFDVVNMVICAGGKPVFLDIDLDSFSPDLKEIKKYYNNKINLGIESNLGKKNCIR